MRGAHDAASTARRSSQRARCSSSCRLNSAVVASSEASSGNVNAALRAVRFARMRQRARSHVVGSESWTRKRVQRDVDLLLKQQRAEDVSRVRVEVASARREADGVASGLLEGVRAGARLSGGVAVRGGWGRRLHRPPNLAKPSGLGNCACVDLWDTDPHGSRRTHAPGLPLSKDLLVLTAEEMCELEAEALRMYADARWDPEIPIPPAVLVRALYGTAIVRSASLPRESLVSTVDGIITICVRSTIMAAKARFLAFHEASHPRLASTCGDDPHVEDKCNYIAGALSVPRPAFMKKTQELGHHVHRLAQAFGTTQAVILLRLGELCSRSVKLTGMREIVRGPEFDWPDTRLALAGKVRKICHPVRLTDERKLGLMATVARVRRT